jgi:hypothetical protein
MTFTSQFLDAELKQKIDILDSSNFISTKNELIDYVRINFKNPAKHIAIIESKRSPRKLQDLYYDYLQAASGNKVI